MHSLIAPLSNQQQEIMKDLLESVQTNRLQSQFEKYLPTVIDGEAPEKLKKAKNDEGAKWFLSEGTEVTGNRETVQIFFKLLRICDAKYNGGDIFVFDAPCQSKFS